MGERGGTLRHTGAHEGNADASDRGPEVRMNGLGESPRVKVAVAGVSRGNDELPFPYINAWDMIE